MFPVKSLRFAFLLLFVVPVTLLGLYHWDVSRNRGYEVGYYGDFNRLRHALSGMPGVTITSEWFHADVTLEEFGFELTVGTSPVINLFFQEDEKVRDMEGESLTRALATKIQSQADLKE